MITEKNEFCHLLVQILYLDFNPWTWQNYVIVLWWRSSIVSSTYTLNLRATGEVEKYCKLLKPLYILKYIVVMFVKSIKDQVILQGGYLWFHSNTLRLLKKICFTRNTEHILTKGIQSISRWTLIKWIKKHYN